MEEDLAQSKVAMVYGQMNEPPGNRLRVALTGLTIAESFRDEGRDVLFFVDNIYRYTLAGTEVSALLGRMPSAVGYQPTLAEEMGRLQGASPPPRSARSPPSRPLRDIIAILGMDELEWTNGQWNGMTEWNGQWNGLTERIERIAFYMVGNDRRGVREGQEGRLISEHHPR